MGKLKRFSELKKVAEFCTPENVSEIHKLRQDAKRRNFDLSFNDALIIHIAKKRKVTMISWDAAMVDFANEVGVNAYKPSCL